MKKRKSHIAIAIIMLTSFILPLSGCSASLTGTFVSVSDSSVSLVFDRDAVSLYESGSLIRSGTFTLSARTPYGYLLIVAYEGAETDERFWLDDSRNVLRFNVLDGARNTVGDNAFEKE